MKEEEEELHRLEKRRKDVPSIWERKNKSRDVGRNSLVKELLIVHTGGSKDCLNTLTITKRTFF